MVVDKYVSRCLDVGSTPTGSIYLLETASNRCFFIKDSLLRFLLIVLDWVLPIF